MIRPGAMRDRLQLNTVTNGRNAFGQPESTLTPVATVWAELVSIATVTAQEAGGPAPVTRATFRIRYRAVSVDQVVIWGGQQYRVMSSSDPSARRVELLIEVER